MNKRENSLKDEAIILIAKGDSSREVARKLGIGKSTAARWAREYHGNLRSKENRVEEVEQVAQIIKAPETRISDRYAKYVDTLRTVKNRQSKWAGAITETGIRTLKLANQYLAIAEKKGASNQKLSGAELNLIKLIPSLMSSSASAIKSATEAEDRAYSLEKLVNTLNELPQQVQSNNRS